MVMVPAVPPLPMAAMSPLTQAKLLMPSVQLDGVTVFQFPLPSTGVAGVPPLESQVRVCPNTGREHSAIAVTASNLLIFLRVARPF